MVETNPSPPSKPLDVPFEQQSAIRRKRSKRVKERKLSMVKKAITVSRSEQVRSYLRRIVVSQYIRFQSNNHKSKSHRHSNIRSSMVLVRRKSQRGATASFARCFVCSVPHLFMVGMMTTMLMLALLVQPSDAQIGTTVCVCSPSSYNITLDFTKTCEDTNLELSAGIFDSSCVLFEMGSSNTGDLVPVSVSEIEIWEFDQDLRDAAYSVYAGPFDNGDSILFISFGSDTGQVSEALFPIGIEVMATGKNAAGQPVGIYMHIKYTTDCSSFSILSKGSMVGWLTFVSAFYLHSSGVYDYWYLLTHHRNSKD